MSFWIAFGSALGGVLRYWCSGLIARWVGETFPWGTIAVNVVGSLLIGLFATLSGPDGRVFVGTTARQFVMLGLLGGFTTFSSFSLQTLALAQKRPMGARGDQHRGLGPPLPDGRMARPRRCRRDQSLRSARCSCPRKRYCCGSSWGRTRREAGRCTKRSWSKRVRCTSPPPRCCAARWGFGRSSRLHTAKIVRLSEDLPVVVEIVDGEAQIRGFLEAIAPMMGNGLVTLEKVQVLRYGDRDS